MLKGYASRTTFRRVAAGVIAIGVCVAAVEVKADDWNDCNSSPADRRIDSCTNLIMSGALDGKKLASAYYNRGNGYYGKADYKRAIVDYSKALQINSNIPEAYYNRGVAYQILGELTLALSDFKTVAQLLPLSNSLTSVVRGRIASIENALPARSSSPSTMAPKRPAISNGTGIVVSTDGRVLTNSHIIDECEEISVRRNDDTAKPATVVYTDKANDLAILKMEAELSERDVAAIRIAPSVRNGEGIATYGFPLAGALSSSGNITQGNISALTGLGDDARFFQLTAPIQPGNSGGPLLDEAANVIGIVTSKLDEIAVAKVAGSLPQNVNFAIKASVATIFLEAHGVKYRTASSDDQLDLPSIADIARRFTVHVTCQ